MEVRGVSIEQFRTCLREISQEKYGGNIRIGYRSRSTASTLNRPNCRIGLRVTDSRGAGARTSASGRHGPYACWHAWRDVLQCVFERYPDAVVTGGRYWRVAYLGLAGFTRTYPETGTMDIGSEASPVTMPELCDCDLTGLGTALREVELAALVGAYDEYSATWTGADTHLAAGTLTATADPDYVSPEVAAASRTMAASAQLLGDDDKDKPDVVDGFELVFGPDYFRTG